MLYFIIISLILVFDIFTKYLSSFYFKVSEIEVIKNILYFTYVENRGAAFGIMQNKQWFFILITLILIIAMILYILKVKPQDILLKLSLSFIIGGGIGNLIDRVFKGYVVDFIDLRIINYPVFNIADCFVVIGAVLLCVYILFSKEK
ncbi:MAG: signal peptidase II [Ruminococcaceae bacterium]|nr:signal peptidase II [Oscillospiraceae bacterium]